MTCLRFQYSPHQTSAAPTNPAAPTAAAAAAPTARSASAKDESCWVARLSVTAVAITKPTGGPWPARGSANAVLASAIQSSAYLRGTAR